MDAFTRTVLTSALGQSRAWRAGGLFTRVSVNVSMDNLVAPAFADVVLALLEQHDLPPFSLRLEVGEPRLLRDPLGALDTLARLQQEGVGLAIDDVGTGRASLAQLRTLPFDTLKIDGGFVHGCRDRATLRAVVVGGVEMARGLGMRVVAEGVEDLADWQAVRAAGCDIAQGFFIARPMPGDRLPDWAARFARRIPALN
jgi:EAL domain-containing protein (putative c-di-GMP-specific phosphodiesterase class I)